jgi:hypothetical protein
LESGVERDVARVVEEEIELDLVIARTSEQRGVERVGFRRYEHFIRHAVKVLPPRRLEAEKGAQRRAVLRGRLPPVFLDGVPALAQPFGIGVAVLRDDRGDPVGMHESEAEANRRTIVEDVDGMACEPDRCREAIHHLREMIEGIREVRPIRRVRKAETREIGRHDMIPVGEQRDEIAKHVRRTREPVHQ